MEIDTDRLQERLYLFGGIALGPHRGLSYGRRAEGGDGLQILHQQRTRHDRGEVVIIRDLRTAGREQLFCRALGDVEESVDLVLLNGMASLSDTRITSHHLRALEAVETTDDAAGGGCIIEVDDTDRHILRQSLVHQRSEEQQREERKDQHAEAVNAILQKNLAFTLRNRPDVYQVSHLMIRLMPGRRPSSFSTGRALTSNVRRSY